jgi:hypothetical protein
LSLTITPPFFCPNLHAEFARTLVLRHQGNERYLS